MTYAKYKLDKMLIENILYTKILFLTLIVFTEIKKHKK